MIWLIFLSILCSTYIVGLSWILYAWHHTKPITKLDIEKELRLTLIIALRNEENNIPALYESIHSQTLDKTLYEVILMNDHSEDETHQMLLSHFTDSSVYKIYALPIGKQGKKEAIEMGIRQASGDIIITTDADCIASPFWLEKIKDGYASSDIQALSAPVVITDDSFFARLQQMEFMTLVATGGGMINTGSAGMCNGANFSYRKESFHAVKGFDGNKDVASGDDEFLLRKFFLKKFKVVFIRDEGSIVYTQAQPTLRAFLKQRARWASKWNQHKDALTPFLAIYAFIIGWLIPICGIGAVCAPRYAAILLCISAMKVLTDSIFILSIFKSLRVRFYLYIFLLWETLYPVYISVVVLYITFGKTEWKGRKIAM